MLGDIASVTESYGRLSREVLRLLVSLTAVSVLLLSFSSGVVIANDPGDPG